MMTKPAAIAAVKSFGATVHQYLRVGPSLPHTIAQRVILVLAVAPRVVRQIKREVSHSFSSPFFNPSEQLPSAAGLCTARAWPQ